MMFSSETKQEIFPFFIPHWCLRLFIATEQQQQQH
jgi:hypothetical protein